MTDNNTCACGHDHDKHQPQPDFEGMIAEAKKHTGYNVMEMFDSYQGEGSYAGFPAIFIRLSGCNFDCEWCDTAASKSGTEGTWLSMDEIEEFVAKSRTPIVVITGGEPTLQDLAPLSMLLRGHRRMVHLETNGSNPVDPKLFDWVVCSPKPHNDYQIHPECKFAELKFVASQELEKRHIEPWVNKARIWLHPQYFDKDSAGRAVEMVELFSPMAVRLGSQQHKLWGVE